MINDKVDPFITQYRDALDRQKDLSMQNLDNARRNDFRSVMGNANTSGMLYSNFPQRTKIQYDTATYMPGQAKIQSTYQTGLDKLRSNTVDISNQLKSINEAIADLNKTNSGGGNGSNTYTITIGDEKYTVTGQPTVRNGRYEYNTADGKGIVSIDPNAVKVK